MAKHLVLIGAGHAHLKTLAELGSITGAGHRVTVISIGSYHYYSGMGPGMLGGFYSPEGIRIPVREMAQRGGGEFLSDEVIRIEPDQRRLKLESGREIGYDVASFNTGSGIPISVSGGNGENLFPVKPIPNLIEAQKRIREWEKDRPLQIAVIGGGPAGVEISGNLRRLSPDAGIRLYSDSPILAGADPKVRRYARENLKRRGIELQENIGVKAIRERTLLLPGGRNVDADLIFAAVGVKPSPIFAEAGLAVGPDGGLAVNEYLQSVSHPNLFGGGDCIRFSPKPLAKAGVHAVRQNPILLHNLSAALEGRPLERFTPQKGFLLILNMGDGSGILFRNSLVLRGRLPFRLKDHIDRRFVRTYQGNGS